VLRFLSEFDGARVIRLTTSYRCSPHALSLQPPPRGRHTRA